MPPEERRPVTEDGEATSTTQEPAAAAAARAHELEEVGPTSATRRLESWRRFLSAIYSAADCEAEYCDERVRLSVCVCLSAIVSSELHVRSSPIFVLLVTCDHRSVLLWRGVIRYVLPVLWMTSYLSISKGCSTSWPI